MNASSIKAIVTKYHSVGGLQINLNLELMVLEVEKFQNYQVLERVVFQVANCQILAVLSDSGRRR